MIDESTHCPFKKHRGRKWSVVAREDTDYLYWLIGPDGPKTMTQTAAAAIEEALEDLEEDTQISFFGE